MVEVACTTRSLTAMVCASSKKAIFLFSKAAPCGWRAS
jgi:hypothetical protein